MKICMLFEGSYPHVTGGVSTWAQLLIENLKEYQYALYTISAESRYKEKFGYKLPANVLTVREIFLDKILESRGKYGKKYYLSNSVRQGLKALICGDKINWIPLLDTVKKRKIKNALDFFMSIDFFDILKEAYIEKFSQVPFTDFFWTVRSMLLPLFYIFEQPVPKADLYHSASNGYTGLVGALAKHTYGKPFLLTEHGIYSREREEEIIKSSWVGGQFKDLWINFFKNISRMVYGYADGVFTLFEKNRELEIELGCNPEKIDIIPNGIKPLYFKKINKKSGDGVINIGSITRVAPIKDIKTMIQSFNIINRELKAVRLFIMGPIDEDEEYYEECRQLVKRLKLTNIRFTGKVDIREYLGKMDIMLLTSISEGQPFVILESMAAGIPFIATDVGGCRELIYGNNDGLGRAGLIVPMMNISQIARAVISLCRNENLRKTFGENGKKRVSRFYTAEKCINNYREVYQKFLNPS